eukprot:2862343-Prymnesium_polylepis.2
MPDDNVDLAPHLFIFRRHAKIPPHLYIRETRCQSAIQVIPKAQLFVVACRPMLRGTVTRCLLVARPAYLLVACGQGPATWCATGTKMLGLVDQTQLRLEASTGGAVGPAWGVWRAPRCA